MPAPVDGGIPVPVLKENAQPIGLKFDPFPDDDRYPGFKNFTSHYLSPRWEQEDPQEFVVSVRAKGYEDEKAGELQQLLSEMKVHLLATTVPEPAAPATARVEEPPDLAGEPGVDQVVLVDLQLTNPGSLKGGTIIQGWYVDPRGNAGTLYQFRPTSGAVTRVSARVYTGDIRLRCSLSGTPRVISVVTSPSPWYGCGGGRSVYVRCLQNGTRFSIYGGYALA
jgi:hypothetical protein